MTNNSYPRRLLDDAIDRAVHELVQAEPRPGLRRRVIAKVNAPARRSSWAIRVLLPAGAMAAIVLLAMWLRPGTTQPAEPPVSQVVQQQPATAPPQVEAPAPITSAPTAPPAVARRSSPRRQPPVQFAFGAPTDRVSATSVTKPLDRPAAPADGPGAPAMDLPMALPPLHIAPIEVKPTAVALWLAVLTGIPPVTSPTEQEKKVNAPAETAPAGRHPGQGVNIKIDLTITDQREGQAGTPKTITMMIADRGRGQLRSNGGGGQMLNVDARPEIVRESRVRVDVNFDYRGPQTDNDKNPPVLTQSLVSVVDDGKPLVISHWGEMGSNRTIRIELRASVQK
jgi:hypothetical protein